MQIIVSIFELDSHLKSDIKVSKLIEINKKNYYKITIIQSIDSIRYQTK